MFEGVKQFVQYVGGLVKPQQLDHVVDGEHYKVIPSEDGISLGDHIRKPGPVAKPTLKIVTVTGFVDAFKAKLDELPTRVAAHVVSPTEVALVSLDADEFGRRHEFVKATCADRNAFPFDQYVNPEQFILALQSGFLPTENVIALQKLASSLSAENSIAVQDDGQWVEAKKGSCLNVRAGVTMDWSDSGQRGYMGGNSKLRKPGETLQVCIAACCKVHRKDWEKPKSANRNAYTPPDPAEEKRKREEQEFIEKEESKIRAKIFDAILAKLDASRALRLVTDEDQSAPSWRKRILALFPAIGGDQLEAYTAFCGTFSGECRVNAYWMMQQGGVVNDRKDLWALAKKVGVDASAVTAKHFHDAGSIAPAADRLYPKGVPWPKDSKPGAAARKTPAKKVAAKVKAKPVKKLSAEGRKKIADALHKRWANRAKRRRRWDEVSRAKS